MDLEKFTEGFDMKKFLDIGTEEINQRVKESEKTQVDISKYPSPIPEVYLVSEAVALRHGYVLETKEKDWYVNPYCKNLRVIPLKEGVLENAPFYISALLVATETKLRLAERDGIIEDILTSDYKSIPLMDQQIHGLEVLTSDTEELGLELREILRKGHLNRRLKERTTVYRGFECYGHLTTVFYFPSTPSELVEPDLTQPGLL